MSVSLFQYKRIKCIVSWWFHNSLFNSISFQTDSRVNLQYCTTSLADTYVGCLSPLIPDVLLVAFENWGSEIVMTSDMARFIASFTVRASTVTQNLVYNITSKVRYEVQKQIYYHGCWLLSGPVSCNCTVTFINFKMLEFWAAFFSGDSKQLKFCQGISICQYLLAVLTQITSSWSDTYIVNRPGLQYLLPWVSLQLTNLAQLL